MFKLRLRKDAGDHVLPSGTVIGAGGIFSSTQALHKKFVNKFDLISAHADTKAKAAEDEDEPEVPDLVDKTVNFPMAEEKGLQVFRSRSTKEYCIVDPTTEDGEPIEEGMTRDAVELYLAPEEETDEDAKVISNRKSLTAAKAKGVDSKLAETEEKVQKENDEEHEEVEEEDEETDEVVKKKKKKKKKSKE